MPLDYIISGALCAFALYYLARSTRYEPPLSKNARVKKLIERSNEEYALRAEKWEYPSAKLEAEPEIEMERRLRG